MQISWRVALGNSFDRLVCAVKDFFLSQLAQLTSLHVNRMKVKHQLSAEHIGVTQKTGRAAANCVMALLHRPFPFDSIVSHFIEK